MWVCEMCEMWIWEGQLGRSVGLRYRAAVDRPTFPNFYSQDANVSVNRKPGTSVIKYSGDGVLVDC